jgi:hypothetical protein
LAVYLGSDGSFDQIWKAALDRGGCGNPQDAMENNQRNTTSVSLIWKLDHRLEMGAFDDPRISTNFQHADPGPKSARPAAGRLSPEDLTDETKIPRDDGVCFAEDQRSYLRPVQ